MSEVRLRNTARLDQWLTSLSDRDAEAIVCVGLSGQPGDADLTILIPQNMDHQLLAKVLARAVVKLTAGEYTR